MIYHRIPIKYVDNKRKSDCCIATPVVMTYGIRENKEFKDKVAVDGPVESYSLPIVLQDDKLIAVFDGILQKCKDYLKERNTKEALGKGDDQLDPFTSIMSIYHRARDNGKIVSGVPPTLYPKLLTAYSKVRDPAIKPTILTKFWDGESCSTEIDPSTMVGVRANIYAAIIIKDIYIGMKPSIQLKVHDVIVVKRLDEHRNMLQFMVTQPTTSDDVDTDEDAPQMIMRR
jgi:hypothetical protein